MEDLEAYPLKPNPTATSGATGVVYQLETMMLCTASHELNVFIQVRQPKSTVLGDGIFQDLPKMRCQVGKRTLVHFVRPAVRSCSSAAAVTAAEGLGNRPSSIFRRYHCARHCKCSFAESSVSMKKRTRGRDWRPPLALLDPTTQRWTYRARLENDRWRQAARTVSPNSVSHDL